ncbi:MAG: aminoacyl-histidine dipeptidase [Lachnospiraceae bacterium]|nr:aminoacyl-histidine dipeptidase [Lachnospiraceae bacterium]
MECLDALKLGKVFYFFGELSKIPHASYHVEEISDYLVSFAKERGLAYRQDECLNVIIKKDATQGYENAEPVMLQGHMDMVAVKKPEAAIDMDKDPLELCVEGDLLYAKDTSLGGDDGIAVAMGLALLDADDIPHPALEVVFTTNEETGMEGANGISFADCKAKRLINMDSEDEGILLAGCAGGARANCHLPVTRVTKTGKCYELHVDGLQGGHSGTEIHKGLANANCLMGRIIWKLWDTMKISVISLEGGLADNAIPRTCTSEIFLDEEEAAAKETVLRELLQRLEAAYKTEWRGKESSLEITLTPKEKGDFSVLNAESMERLAALYNSMPNGVVAMSHDVDGLVETSLNLGVTKLDEKEFVLRYSVRSSKDCAKEALLEKIKSLLHLAGGTVTITGEYPGWAYRQESPLRDLMVRVFKEQYGKEPVIEAIHAGLECGLFSTKIQDLDCVSIGPDIFHIHTTEEALSISSTKRVWEFLLEVLRQSNEK